MVLSGLKLKDYGVEKMTFAKTRDPETMGGVSYPLNLFLRVINVSLKTMKIVDGLPNLDI